MLSFDQSTLLAAVDQLSLLSDLNKVPMTWLPTGKFIDSLLTTLMKETFNRYLSSLERGDPEYAGLFKRFKDARKYSVPVHHQKQEFVSVHYHTMPELVSRAHYSTDFRSVPLA